MARSSIIKLYKIKPFIEAFALLFFFFLFFIAHIQINSTCNVENKTRTRLNKLRLFLIKDNKTTKKALRKSVINIKRDTKKKKKRNSNKLKRKKPSGNGRTGNIEGNHLKDSV